ncbi:MAG: hypothetical protein ACFFED_06685 [Candidatus Thorarchaeota archaeon]
MYEIAIFSALISVIVTIVYIVQSWQRKKRNDLIFAGFAFAMILHNLNLYTWLNLPTSDPIVTILRAMDYFYGLPLLSLGVYFLHVSAEARIEKPSIWAVRTIMIAFAISLPVVSIFYILIDPEFARRVAVVFLIPLFTALPVYYFNHFRKYPYRTTKPEYERGYRVIMLGYFSMVLGTGIFAGLFRMIDLGIAFEAISVVLVGLGGYIIGTVTYAGLYEKLEILLLIVDDQGRIVESNLPPEGTSINKLAHTTLSYLLDGVERVMRSGDGFTIPSIRIDPLGISRRFKVDILPHELGTDGSPLSVVIALTDVTGALEGMESEQLSEILSRYKGEREKASFYLDLLSHDMANIIQGMLLGIETAFHQIKRNMNVLESLTMVSDEIDRSMILLKETKIMVLANETTRMLVDTDVVKCIEEALVDIHELYPRANITFNAHFPPEDYAIQAENMLKYAFFSVFRFIIDNINTSEGKVTVKIEHQEKAGTIVVEISCEEFDIKSLDLMSLFDWHSRNPSGGVGLPLANVLVGRYNGKISVREGVDREHSSGVIFRLEFPTTQIKRTA